LTPKNGPLRAGDRDRDVAAAARDASPTSAKERR
jgi:hypothetical protein